eukprot:480161-Rhodomonas_salina.2
MFAKETAECEAADQRAEKELVELEEAEQEAEREVRTAHEHFREIVDSILRGQAFGALCKKQTQLKRGWKKSGTRCWRGRRRQTDTARATINSRHPKVSPFRCHPPREVPGIDAKSVVVRDRGRPRRFTARAAP